MVTMVVCTLLMLELSAQVTMVASTSLVMESSTLVTMIFSTLLIITAEIWTLAVSSLVMMESSTLVTMVVFTHVGLMMKILTQVSNFGSFHRSNDENVDPPGNYGSFHLVNGGHFYPDFADCLLATKARENSAVSNFRCFVTAAWNRYTFAS